MAGERATKPATKREDSAGRSSATSVAILGAGVIGQSIAARLATCGVPVTLVARGRTLEGLRAHGIRIRWSGEALRSVRVGVADARDGLPAADVLLVTGRRDQLHDLAELASAWRGPRVVVMSNVGGRTDALRRELGAERTSFAFPGIGGIRSDDGIVTATTTAQQRMTVDPRADGSSLAGRLFREAGLAVDETPDIDAWLDTHLVFLTAFSCAGLVTGSKRVLSRHPRAVADTARAVRDGLRVLERRGAPILPDAIRIGFLRAPIPIISTYFRVAIAGALGDIIVDHAHRSAATEMPALIAGVRELLGDELPPTLATVLAAGERRTRA